MHFYAIVYEYVVLIIFFGPNIINSVVILDGLQYLVSRWRRFEIQYWTVLLEKVELECETQADKVSNWQVATLVCLHRYSEYRIISE